MPAYNSNVDVTFRGQQGNEACVVQLEYHREEPVTASIAQQLAINIKDDIWTPLKDILSTLYTLLEIVVVVRQIINEVGVTDEYTLPVNETGLLGGDVLPPQVTMSIIKNPNPTTIWPVAAVPFRKGKMGWSGIPEAAQNDGLYNGAYIADWATRAANFLTIGVDVLGTPYTWQLGLERGEIDPVKVLVDSLTVRQKTGSQNTRKRR